VAAPRPICKRSSKALSSFQVLMAGFTGLPIALPGTSYKRALDARG
jgi:hypothetical protein